VKFALKIAMRERLLGILIIILRRP